MESQTNSALAISAKTSRIGLTSDKERSLANRNRPASGTLAHPSMAILDLITSGILVSDGAGCVAYMNAQAEDILGRSVGQMMGRPIIDVFINSDYDLVGSEHAATTSSVFEGKFVVQFETRNTGKRSLEIRIIPLPDDIAGVGGELYEIHDVSESIRHTRQLLHDATHDPLTGLANRRALTERLSQCACWEPETGFECVLAMLDLDGFKQINDACGHLAGDDVLQAVARVLQAHTRKADMTARLGGDEFVVLLIDCGIEEAHRILNSIREAIGSYRYTLDGTEYRISVSIGAACIDRCGIEISQLLRQADKACYSAKYAGGNRIVAETEFRKGFSGI